MRQVTTGELKANLTDMQSAAGAKVLFDEVGTKVIAMISITHDTSVMLQTLRCVNHAGR